MKRVLTLATLALSVLIAPCGGGEEPTQLVVIIHTDLGVPDPIAQVELVVRGPSGTESTYGSDVTTASAFPLTFGLVPAGGDLGPVHLTAIGSDATHASVVETAASVTLEAGVSRVLVLYLVGSCRGGEARCGAGRTCRPSGCGPLEVPPSDLPVFRGTTDRCAYDEDADGDGLADEPCGGPDCGWGDPAVGPGNAELCDGQDNDCNGSTDEGCACAPIGTSESCSTVCGSTSMRTCEDPGMWGPCTPPPEVCNGIDEDCNGIVDDGFVYDVRAFSPIGDVEGVTIRQADVVRAGDSWAFALGAGSDGMVGRVILRRYDDTLTPTAAPLAMLLPMDALDVEIGWTGTHFGVLWNTAEGYECGCDPYGGGCSTCYTYPLWFRVVDTIGSPVGMETRLGDNADAATRRRVLWTGTEHLTVRTESRTTRFVTFGPDGTMQGMGMLDLHVADSLDFDTEDGAWVIGWANNDVHYVRGTGVTADPDLVVVARDGMHQADKARIAATGDGVVIAYVNIQTNLLDVVGIDDAGMARGMPQAVMTTATPAIRSAPFAATGGRGQAIVVVAMAEGISLARAAPDGTVIQPLTLLSTMASTTTRELQLDWDVATGALVWRDAANAIQAAVIGCPAAGPVPDP